MEMFGDKYETEMNMEFITVNMKHSKIYIWKLFIHRVR
jgi:hypothetical protein